VIGAGVSLSPPSWDWERRRRFVRHHGDVVGNYGQLTAGSSRSTDGLCRMVLDTGIGMNKIAETTEHFHRDFLAYRTPGTDAIWRKTQIVEGMFIPEVMDAPQDGAYMSIGLGSPNSAPPFVYDENYCALRYNLFTGTWEAVVNCPGLATVNIVDLGATAGGIIVAFATTWSYKIRVEYQPRVQVRFWLNDQLAHTFTDAATMQALWDDATVASDEVGAYFVSTGMDLAAQTSAVFSPMYCESIL